MIFMCLGVLLCGVAVTIHEARRQTDERIIRRVTEVRHITEVRRITIRQIVTVHSDISRDLDYRRGLNYVTHIVIPDIREGYSGRGRNCYFYLSQDNSWWMIRDDERRPVFISMDNIIPVANNVRLEQVCR